MKAAPTITVLTDNLRGKSFLLQRPKYNVGRDRKMDICLEHTSVSSRHCLLEKNKNGTYSVVDENISTNGTRLAGRLITRHTLIDGDVVQFGGVECIFHDGSNSSATTHNSVNTQIQLDGNNTIAANSDVQIKPSWLKSNNGESQAVKLGMRVILSGLALVVVVLAAVLAFKLVGT